MIEARALRTDERRARCCDMLVEEGGGGGEDAVEGGAVFDGLGAALALVCGGEGVRGAG